jgi:3-phosphoshikimate 1-carboxyvinyltransferase
MNRQSAQSNGAPASEAHEAAEPALKGEITPLPLVGSVAVPGDKSISHRALILSALADGPAVVSNLNPGDDVRATCDVLRQLGVLCEAVSKDVVEVQGCGLRRLREPDNVLDAHNSGTTIRLGLGLLAGAPLGAVVTGDASLRGRPMRRVVEPLRRLGAEIDGRHNGDRAPLWVRGRSLRGVDIVTEVASAQVKSAVLLAALGATGTTSVTEPAPSRDHTERMLAAAGVVLDRSGPTVSVAGGQELRAMDRRIPGDLSSAMYLIVAAALIGGSNLEITDLGLNPTRCGGLEVLADMGADLRAEVLGEWGGEPVGRVTVRASELHGADIDPALVPSLVDELPVLAVAASQARGTTVIAGAQELRVKESDRIDVLAAGLRRLGADVETRPDGLVVRGPARLRSAAVDALGDHRMALSFAVAGLISGREVEIKGWESVAVSFPSWSEVLSTATGGGRE